MLCPFAAYKPVVNHGGPMAGHIGLVLHVQQGTGSLAGFFNNPASQVSAHFWVSQSGALEQYVDTDLTAWAEVNGNANYLSVETEGFDTGGLTAAQIATLARLLLWCAETFSFPLNGPVPHGQPGFTPHCNPDGSPDPAWGGHPCPGPIRLGQMNAILAAAAPPPAPIQEDAMQIVAYDPKTGGYWVTDENGDCYAGGGAPFVAGLNQHPDYHAGSAESGGANPCVGITYWAAFGNDGIMYFTKPTSGKGGWAGTPYSTYRFLRSGQPA